jgi:hypothetical protein
MSNFPGNLSREPSDLGLFRGMNIATTPDITRILGHNRIALAQRFFISSHGKQLLHSEFPPMRVPDNINLYFQSPFGESCERPPSQDTAIYVCYSSDFLNLFKDSTGNWINRVPGGTVINDCVLTVGRYFLSYVMACTTVFGANPIINLRGGRVLLSNALQEILGYAAFYGLQGPFDVFCSFCLGESNLSYSELAQRRPWNPSPLQYSLDQTYFGGKINNKNRKNFKKKSFKKKKNKSKRCRKITIRKLTRRKK